MELLQSFANSEPPITIEVNLTSNVKRMNFDFTKHPVTTFIKNNIPVCLNCDNQFLGNTTSSQEIDHFIYDVGKESDEYSFE